MTHVPLLEAADLRLRFGVTDALTGASIDVAAGDIVAIIGPSGSGKSTLLHCLAGILVPDSGEVRYRGTRIDSITDAERSALRRSQFGFVFQFGQLVPELSATENVALPPLLNGVSRGEATRLAREWLERLDVADVADKRPGEMSGGQQQRVAIARAVAHRPAVVFADEPTGALDTFNGERVMELLTGLARDEGAALVLVTHDMRVAAYAEREVVVRDGRTSATRGART